jgi:hypothetical protein
MKIDIIENFLNEKDLKELSSIKFENINSYEIKVFHNKIDKNNNVEAECLSPTTVKRLHDTYHQKAMSLLNKLCPEKINLYDHSEFHIILTGANYKFPIHDDIPTKLLSGVVYLDPEINKGTMFFNNKKGDGKKYIEWKKNKAVFFARKEGETWHSYEGDGKSQRLTLVYNLMTKDFKRVCEIEKKNYFLCLIGFKLNPIIFRLFKKLI